MLILSGGDNISNQADRQWERQSRLLMDLLGDMGLDATAVQAQDLLLGLDVLQGFGAQEGYALLCGNLMDGSGKAVFPSYRIFELGGKKLGVLAVTDPRLQHGVQKMPAGLTFADPGPVMEAGVRALREHEGCAAVVLLYGGRREQALEACKTLTGVDLIFFGNSTISQRVPTETESGVPVYTAGNRGKDFGEIQLTLKDDGSVALSPMQIHELDKNYPEQPEVAARVAALKAELDAEKQRTQLIEQLARQTSETEVTEAFLGSETCKRCHEAEYTSFMATAHAQALASLEHDFQDNNPDCVSCHVTGWQQPGGYGLDAVNRNKLKGVQCEACHGYGTTHARNQPAASEPAAMCLRCHDAANSPEFNYKRYWEKIKH